MEKFEMLHIDKEGFPIAHGVGITISRDSENCESILFDCHDSNKRVIFRLHQQDVIDSLKGLGII